MHSILRLSFLAFSFLLVLTPDSNARISSKKVILDLAREARELSTTSPKDNETCFAPDEPCSGKLVKFIETAKETLDIAIFEMTDQRVAKAIAEASQKTKVRIVMNPKLYREKNSPCLEILRASKAELRPGKQKGIMHNKFTIVDGKRMETGSYNYSYGASNANQENQLYLSTPSVVSRYQERFEKMWKEARH